MTMWRTCLRNVNNVNKFELFSVYEYICITWEFPMHFRTAKLYVSQQKFLYSYRPLCLFFMSWYMYARAYQPNSHSPCY